MDELTIGDKIYISSKKSAKITGYAKDYIGQLCREGRVEARLVGRNWYVLESSIREHRFGKEMPVEAPVTAESAETADLTATWQTPTYKAEEETPILPPLNVLQEPVEPPVSVPAATDMEAAWKEWFDTKRTESPISEEEPEIGTQEGSDAAAAEPVEEEKASDIANDEAIFGGPVVPVSLHRGAFAEDVNKYSEEPETSENDDYQIDLSVEEEDEVTLESRREDVVDLSRRSSPRAQEFGQREEEPMTPRRRVQRNVPKAAGPAKVVQALLIAIAGLSLVIALIGSGLADYLLGTGENQPRIESPVIDLIQGESEYK